MLFSTLTLVAAMLTSVTHAEFLAQEDLPTAKINCCDWSYVVPNEQNPNDAAMLLRNAPRGVYVAVGTERGFIGAALTPNASHLLLADIDAKVVLYNKINIALLKLATSRADYLRLRLEADFEEWFKRVGKPGRIEDLEVAILAQKGTWNWWEDRVRDEPGFKPFQAPPGKQDTLYAFRDANYLYNEDLFWRIKGLAADGNIQAIQIDLGDLKSVEILSKALQHAGLKIGVFDPSNAWNDTYMGMIKTLRMIEKLRDSARDESLVLFTGGDKDLTKSDPTWNKIYDSRYKKSIFSLGHHIMRWGYRTFTFKFLEDPKNYPDLKNWTKDNNRTLNQP